MHVIWRRICVACNMEKYICYTYWSPESYPEIFRFPFLWFCGFEQVGQTPARVLQHTAIHKIHTQQCTSIHKHAQLRIIHNTTQQVQKNTWIYNNQCNLDQNQEFLNDSIFCSIMITNIKYDQYALLNLWALQSFGIDALGYFSLFMCFPALNMYGMYWDSSHVWVLQQSVSLAST